MARVIAIANQKGGVGKTTTTINLGASLAAAEKRVLAIDMDPQGNLTSGLGISLGEGDSQTYHVLHDECAITDAIRATDLEFLSLLPTDNNLVGAEIELVNSERREQRLITRLGSIVDAYDYVLIDCPPSLGLLTLNALVAANSVLIPMQCEYYALEGLTHLSNTIERVRRAFNPKLVIEGILLCMYDKRVNLSQQVATEVREHFGERVFETVIPRNIRLSESPSFGKPVLLYDIDSTGAQSYLQLAHELIVRQTPAQSVHSPASAAPLSVNSLRFETPRSNA